MIAGLPWEAWLLLFGAVGLGLAIEFLFLRARWRERRSGAAGTDERKGGRENPAEGWEGPGTLGDRGEGGASR